MKFILLSFVLLAFYPGIVAQNIKISDPVHFLALGDSYTIGQSVAASENWPNQFAFALSYRGFNVQEVKIVAQTGWRTDNLIDAIHLLQPLTGYNLVSLLIGVNNQFQGRSIQTYTTEFEELLQAAIAIAGNTPEHVFVLSIPDYAYTPFGNGNPGISSQIDQFNAVNRQITENNHVKYIDITPISRSGIIQPGLVASDGLHPSGEMYELWVQEIVKNMEKDLGINNEQTVGEAFTYTLFQRQLKIKSVLKLAELLVYNANGKIIQAQQLDYNPVTTINLSGLPAGMYFLVFRSNTGIAYKSKIVLN